MRRRQARSPARRAPATFDGYVRGDGRVGTRNEIWVLPTVGCVARTAERIAAKMDARRPAGIDGVHAFSHPHGCSQLGADLAGTRAILAALASHPNCGGALLVGLGCEENQLAELVAEIAPERRATLRTLTAQTSADEVAEGCALIEELFALAAAERGAGRARPAGARREVRRVGWPVGADRQSAGRADERCGQRGGRAAWC